MRLDRADVCGFGGTGVFAAGLFGLWGWPAAAIFIGAVLLALAIGASRKG